MNAALYKAIAVVVAIVIAVSFVLWGIRQYGNSRVVAQELSTVTEAVSEAVERRDTAVKADIKTKAQRAATDRKMRSAVNRVESDLANLKPEPRAGVLDPAERGVWNEFIGEANRSILAARVLP